MSSDTSIHVAYVVKRYPRFSETFIVNEVLAHEAAGLTIDIFSLRPPVDTHFQDAISRVRAPVHYVPYKSLRMTDLWSAIEQASEVLPDLWNTLRDARGEDSLDVYQALLLAREARLRGIRHLHAHFANVATTVTRLAARFAGLTYSFTAHAKDIFHESVQADDLQRKITDAAAVITISQFNYEFLRSTFGLAAQNVHHVYNGLELDRLPYCSPNDRLPKIVGVGRLVEKKGFSVLIHACSIVAGRGHQFKCEILGGGELEGELRHCIEHHHCQELVELLGPRPQSAVIADLQSAAVFAAPCVNGIDGNRDGLPTVLLEAMALGTPCVSTDVTGIPEVVHDRETGLLVPQRDPFELANALELLLMDAQLRVQLSHNARALVEEQFDIHQNTSQLRAIFQSAVHAPQEVS